MYQRYGALLSRRCRLLLRDPAQADDAVQELLSVLLRRGGGLRAADSPYRWLCRAADRACIDLLRRGKRLRSAVDIDDIDDLDPVGVAPGMDPEARCAVVESLERLDEEQQSLAIMLFVDGLSQGEAAEELGVSRVTINKRAQALRTLLRISHTATSGEREPGSDARSTKEART
ncbi:MAG: polymerase, sigma-24 subunit, subfamily [Labilithrix sp.]|nr:polymerase, sigma-24 subunit, subfamily [Labilithrix sp.]